MRRSVVLWRTRPEAKGLGSTPPEPDVRAGEDSRWDSERSRRSSRSLARREGASSGRVLDLEEAVVGCG